MVKEQVGRIGNGGKYPLFQRIVLALYTKPVSFCGISSVFNMNVSIDRQMFLHSITHTIRISMVSVDRTL